MPTEPVETFEGLGIGARLALLKVDEKHTWVLVLAAILYGITTPVGISAGLGIRTTYNPGTPTASIVSGTMDSISAGFLIYASLVEVRQLPLENSFRISRVIFTDAECDLNGSFLHLRAIAYGARIFIQQGDHEILQ